MNSASQSDSQGIQLTLVPCEAASNCGLLPIPIPGPGGTLILGRAATGETTKAVGDFGVPPKLLSFVSRRHCQFEVASNHSVNMTALATMQVRATAPVERCGAIARRSSDNGLRQIPFVGFAGSPGTNHVRVPAQDTLKLLRIEGDTLVRGKAMVLRVGDRVTMLVRIAGDNQHAL